MDKPANDTAALVPTIHLNGTARETLLTEYANVVEAINIAISTYVAATCHKRDFYVQPQADARFEAFLAKRQQDISQLMTVRDNVSEILGGMLEQGA